jgi:Flp pilus assembly protein TadD/mono/diheme cytochrome c family protein
MFTGRRGVAQAVTLAFLSGALARAQTQNTTSPTFNRDIAPIVFQNCSPCHQPGQTGPFSLLTYLDVKRHARQIVKVTESRYMPPWLPEEGHGHFRDERRLTDAQIKTIARWVEAGGPEGSPEDLPPAPKITNGWQLGQPDLVVTAASPIVVPASGPDVFWNFTFRPQLTGTRYVNAIEIRPGGLPGRNCAECGTASEIARIHHANMLVDRGGSVARLESKPGAGFPGMEISLDRNPLDPVSHFLFWKPGNLPYEEPDGFSWRIDPGNQLVLNTHLQPSGRPQTVQPSIGLYFTDKPPTHFPLLIELEDDNRLSIPAGARNFIVSDDFRLPMDVNVLAIYPHAHYLGKRLESYATLPDKKRIWLIRIPDWNLNWQSVYRYSQPVFLPKGTVVSMRFSYDNSSNNPRNPNQPPKRVEAGNRASDEMGHLWLQVLPCGRGDRRRELQEAVLRYWLEKIPNDPQAHLNLGALLMSRLETQPAIDELQTAIRLKPDDPEAHDMLGSALRTVGRSTEALGEYRTALRIDPTYMDARYNLATTLARAGKLDEAISNFRQVLTAFPNNSRLRNEFGELLAQTGHFSEALKQFDKALQLDPANQYAAKNRHWVMQKLNAAR